MKTIKVSKITLDSYNKLIALGYKVIVIQESNKPVVFSKYKYNKIVRPKKFKFTCLQTCPTNEHVCDHSYSSACPKQYVNI